MTCPSLPQIGKTSRGCMSTGQRIRIEFEVTPDLLEEMRQGWRASRGEAWEFGLTLFESLVSLRIENDVVLDSVLTPLYPFACGGFNTVQDLPLTRSDRLELAGSSFALNFDMIDDQIVTVTEDIQAKTANVEYDKLMACWAEFANNARAFIVQEFPDVVNRQDTIGRWMRNEECTGVALWWLDGRRFESLAFKAP
jgi:hypothetical protein